MSTPRCDELAREHFRIKAGEDAPGVLQDWIALAQKLERESADRMKYADHLTLALLDLRKKLLPDSSGTAYMVTMAIDAALSKRPQLIPSPLRCHQEGHIVVDLDSVSATHIEDGKAITDGQALWAMVAELRERRERDKEIPAGPLSWFCKCGAEVASSLIFCCFCNAIRPRPDVPAVISENNQEKT